MGNNAPNTDGIIQFQQNQSKEKKEKVLATLKEMLSTGSPISKAEICKRSGVSRTFIYTTPELLEPINEAIKNAPVLPPRLNKQTSDKSKDLIIESLKRRNALLVKENKELRREKEILLGKLASR